MRSAKAFSLFSILALTLRLSQANNCFNRLDIVVAVDTTASLSAQDFATIKSDVKGIFSGFKIGQYAIQLALISVSSSPKVVAQFFDVTALDDFNAKVDSLGFTPDARADFPSAIKLAKDFVFNQARKNKISKVLILVKDRRSETSLVSDSAELTRLKNEASALKSAGVAIHAVGVGGLWNRQELHALYNNGYLLFKDKEKALGAVRSLNNKVCLVECPDSGKTKATKGLCYNRKQHVITVKSDLLKKSGLLVCKQEIYREIGSCVRDQRCNTISRVVSKCSPEGKVTITDKWLIFDSKKQSCKQEKSVKAASCLDATNCPSQVTDVIFVLDKSGSLETTFHFVKAAAKVLISALTVAPNIVRVGVISFGKHPKTVIKLGSILFKNEVLEAYDKRITPIKKHDQTMTHRALRLTRKTFKDHGRPGVAKHLFVITDGKSGYPGKTLQEISLLKAAGVTIHAIGVGFAVRMGTEEFLREIRALAAPHMDNMVLVDDLKTLKAWATTFSNELCLRMADPNPKLCDNSVFIQSISECIDSHQMVTTTAYAYDSHRKCIRTTNATQKVGCRKKCTDPIFGNDYFLGASWEGLCHTFKCTAKGTTLLNTTCPTASGGCKDVNSGPFQCRDLEGKAFDNCKCVRKNGKATLIIEKK